MKNKRYRAFMIVLYPDDDSHQDTLLYIQEFINDYAYILHDKDFTVNGDIKKAHYHVILKTKNAMTISALSKELKISENYITPTKKSYVYGLRYLIHADDTEKFQYSIDEVFGTLKNRLKKSLESDIDESTAVINLLELIENQDYLSMSAFIRLVASSDLWSYYRRNAYTFNLLLSEHNYEILERKGKLSNIDK